MGGFIPSPTPHMLLAKALLTIWCPVADELADLHAFILPRRAPWPSGKSFAVEMASAYDWDTLVLDGGASDAIPGGDFSLGRNGMPRHLKVVGPGTISASATFSLSCRDSDGCTGMEFFSVRVTGQGFSLYLSGAPLQVSNSTLSGARITVGAAALDVTSSTFLDCTFVVERGGALSLLRSTFSGSAFSARPTLYLYSGASASIESCNFENLHSLSSGAALFVMGSQLDVVDSTFLNCSSGGSGGAIHGEPLANPDGEMRSSIVISSSSFSDCLAAAAGGGVSATAAGTRVHVSSSSFARCRSKSGGAITSSDSSPLTVDAGTSFLECSATEDGGAVSVVDGSSIVLDFSTFRNCTAAGRGGAVFVSGGGGSASASVSSCGFWGNGASGLGGGGLYLSNIQHVVGQLECHDNTALFGGGGFLMWEGAFSTVVAGGGVSICDHGSNNHARYGSTFASSFKRLEVQGLPSPESRASSGVTFPVLVSKTDFYGQIIASDSSSLMQVKTSLGGARSDDPSVQLQGTTVSAVQAGTATFEFAVKPSFSLIDADSGTTNLLRAPMVYFEGTDAEVGGQMLSGVSEIPLSLNGAVCPPGYVLSLSGNTSASRPGQCSLCQAGTYSLHPLAGRSSGADPSCLSCPAGGDCLAGGDDVLFPLGTWGVIENTYVLNSCPIGHELTVSLAADECANPSPWKRGLRISYVEPTLIAPFSRAPALKPFEPSTRRCI